MLQEVLDTLPKLNLQELRMVNKDVCNIIRGKHDDRKVTTARKFTEGCRVIHDGKMYVVQSVNGTNLVTNGGRIIPLTQCRLVQKK